MSSTMINEGRFFQTGVNRLFTGKPEEILGELLQNAQRSSSKHVWITFPAPHICVVRDDGHGLLQGVESLRRLLVFSDSNFANPAVEAHQRPLGMGFYSLIANARMQRIAIESYSQADERILEFAIDTQKWLDDGEYRASWQDRVRWRTAEEGEESGFRLTLIGTEPLMTELRTCLLNTPARRAAQDSHGASAYWSHSTMSPACGYSDLLSISVDGEVLDTRLPASMTIAQPEIIAAYLGNVIRISLYPAPTEFLDGSRSLVVNWYGQVILDRRHPGWSAYLHVRAGHPLNPRAPTRAGLIDDEALRAFYQWVEDRIFDWVCSQKLPEVKHVERLYEINKKRAERECPFAIIQPWKPLPVDYVFTSDEVYEESDQLGAKQVIRKNDLPTVLILDETVTCPLRADHPAQEWAVKRDVEQGKIRPEDTVCASFDIGLTSLLRATGLVAYQACTGVPENSISALWWSPGAPVDNLHSTSPGEWAIQNFPTPEDELACLPSMSWHSLPAGTLPVFVVGETEDWDVERCRWIIALAKTEDMVSFLEQCGRAPFVPDDDAYDESVESYDCSLEALIRSYLGNTIARYSVLSELPQMVQGFLPEPYDVRTAAWQFLFAAGSRCPTAIRLRFEDGYEKALQLY